MDDDKTNHYATAGFDEPLTAYIEYTYDQDTDWQSMLDNERKPARGLMIRFWILHITAPVTLPKGTRADTGGQTDEAVLYVYSERKRRCA